jgi:hypothetical protein
MDRQGAMVLHIEPRATYAGGASRTGKYVAMEDLIPLLVGSAPGSPALDYVDQRYGAIA